MRMLLLLLLVDTATCGNERNAATNLHRQATMQMILKTFIVLVKWCASMTLQALLLETATDWLERVIVDQVVTVI